MKEHEVRATIERYNKRLTEFGPTQKALGWGEKGRANIRFEALLSQWDFNGKKVIDVGCGFGDLYGYMESKGIKNFSYLGVDINPTLTEVGTKRYSGAQFEIRDILESPISRKADYVLASGLFNFKLEDSPSFVKAMFDRFNEMATAGFACNFLSNKVQYELEDTFHADPAKILDMAYAYSNNVVLRNDYMPYEFSVFVNKGSRIDQTLTVYEEFIRFEGNR